MTQAELAKELGISKSYMSMILNGKREPTGTITKRLSSLGVHKFEAKSSLARRRSTTELLPLFQTCRYFWCLVPKPRIELGTLGFSVRQWQLFIEMLNHLEDIGQVAKELKKILSENDESMNKIRMLVQNACQDHNASSE